MDDIRQNLADGIHAILRGIAPVRGEAILFGSRARGDARETSDWDVLVLLDKERLAASDVDEVSYPIRELGWEIDAVVNPLLYARRDWEGKSHTPFYKNVMAEGVVL